MSNKNLVAIYCRLSDEDKIKKGEESQSIQNQKSMLLKYALEQSWEVYNIYSDDDYSGAYADEDNNRPAFRQMISDAEERKFGIILCKTQSRFTRNIEMVERYLHGRFVEWGIRFVSIIDNADTNDFSNKKLRQVNGLVNEWYLEDTSKNIRSVFKNKMQKGEYLAAFPPYGYKKDKVIPNHLLINHETAPIVKQIFDWSLEGFGAAKICRMLNDRSVPNPRKQQELDGLRKTFMYADDDFGQWSTTSIGDILHNRTYCGDVVQHKRSKASYKSKKILKMNETDWIVVENMHEPIVNRETYYKVQGNLAKKCKATGTGKPHLLSGKVFCHFCGKPMQKTHSTSTATPHIEYLRCRDKYAYSGRCKCKTPNIRVDNILSAIHFDLISKYEQAFMDNIDFQTLDLLSGDFDNGIKSLRLQIAKLTQEIEKLDKVIKNLYLDKVNEVITDEQFISFNKDFSGKRKSFQNKIDALSEKIEHLDKGKNKNSATYPMLKKYFETKNIDREIIDALIDRIEFGEPDGDTPILKVFWTWCA